MDLIRFPGSIPGDIRCALTEIHYSYTYNSIVSRGKCTKFKIMLGTSVFTTSTGFRSIIVLTFVGLLRLPLGG